MVFMLGSRNNHRLSDKNQPICIALRQLNQEKSLVKFDSPDLV